MKIISRLKGSLILLIIGALLFVYTTPSFAVQSTLRYTYDDLNRLKVIEDVTNNKMVKYEYDEVGNRTQKLIANIFPDPAITLYAQFSNQGIWKWNGTHTSAKTLAPVTAWTVMP